MKLEINDIYPLIRVKTPSKIDFYKEHKLVIDANGYVWFCRFGRNNMKFESLKKCKPVVFIKETGDITKGLYLAKYDSFSSVPPNEIYAIPSYYNEIIQKPSIWFRVTEINKFEIMQLNSSFVGNTSGGNIQDILRSMCPAFFVKCINEVLL